MWSYRQHMWSCISTTPVNTRATGYGILLIDILIDILTRQAPAFRAGGSLKKKKRKSACKEKTLKAKSNRQRDITFTGR